MVPTKRKNKFYHKFCSIIQQINKLGTSLFLKFLKNLVEKTVPLRDKVDAFRFHSLQEAGQFPQ